VITRAPGNYVHSIERSPHNPLQILCPQARACSPEMCSASPPNRTRALKSAISHTQSHAWHRSISYRRSPPTAGFPWKPPKTLLTRNACSQLRQQASIRTSHRSVGARGRGISAR
jgi:hypothetical protein